MTLIHPSSAPAPDIAPSEEAPADQASLSRRGFLRGAAATGAGLVAIGIAACAPAATASGSWAYGQGIPSAGPSGQPAPSPAGSTSPSAAPGASPGMDHGSPAPSGSTGGGPAPEDHDAHAKAVVDRFLGGEGASLSGTGNLPLEARVDGGTKVYEITVEEIEHQIDAINPPVAALGFNGTWPGPRIDVVEGDKIRATFTNKMRESTGIHFHGQALPNAMDGVPHITQDPIPPGGSFTYEFTARTTGSHMYHSHHNATDQVGRGLLGAFIVQPRDEGKRYDKLYGATQDIVWISNDALGGFTINGRGFPATSPIVAKLGETIVIRFMNEGNMTHPWHLHGMPMHIVARDGYPLGSAAFTCDTLGVNPGERWDAVINCEAPGAWAFHCHILQHAEGPDGMFGMVTALVVQDSSAAADAVTARLASATGSSAPARPAVAGPPFDCPIPGSL
jgi:FtsP/CotA-like multicopper oxidase with cupredoxin domain